MISVITGGAGFVATTLAGRVLSEGHRVVAIDNLCRGSLENIRGLLDHPRFEFVHGDLSDLQQARAAFARAGSDNAHCEVWHLAANSDIPAGVANPVIDHRDTFLTTFNTLVAMRDAGMRELFFASSSAIYGDLGDEVLTEDSGPLLPISNYGAMKLASEAQISAATEAFLSRAVLYRFPNVVGVPATHGVLLDFVRKIKADASLLPVLGDGTQRKSYLHVSDLVDAMLLIRARPTTERISLFNVGPIDDGVTVRQIAEEVLAAISPATRPAFGSGNKGWLGDVPQFRYSVRKAMALGWAPSMSSLEAIRRSIREIAAQEGVACVRR